jgi:hypothetical protein
MNSHAANEVAVLAMRARRFSGKYSFGCAELAAARSN